MATQHHIWDSEDLVGEIMKHVEDKLEAALVCKSWHRAAEATKCSICNKLANVAYCDCQSPVCKGCTGECEKCDDYKCLDSDCNCQCVKCDGPCGELYLPDELDECDECGENLCEDCMKDMDHVEICGHFSAANTDYGEDCYDDDNAWGYIDSDEETDED
eukprot:TRINITY_DN13189_c0_g1_i1.p1 TRINITY_DN13189_c0_g1~~TRINITY_DN13189_c0_g1_i1.p1  ORF type:complete len:169 (+),score=20.07 TRINITY_DN13189_c0_g1_i1:30-509(+)